MSTENIPNEYQDLLAELESTTKVSPVEKAGLLRLSIRGNVFRKLADNYEEELDTNAIKVVVVKSAPISRTYYEGEYVVGKNKPPTCWSADTATGRPFKDIPTDNVQSIACFDCKQNIKGSGVGQTRACKYQQRIAVLLADEEGDISSNEVYQLQLPATSLFGKDTQKMSMQTYARFLNNQEKPVPLAALLTEIRFDSQSVTPKLFFKPIRVLEEGEIKLAKEVQTNPDTENLVTLTITPREQVYSNVDNVFDVVEGEGVFVKTL
tara:strand:- start:11865 stop:12659 length:795 start_codon:yes stop_codon:yes gene_type:complete